MLAISYSVSKNKDGISLVQLNQIRPQPTYVMNPIFGMILCMFSCSLSLINTTASYCYWQLDWILFYSRNIIKIFWLRLNLAEAEPEISHGDKGTIPSNVKSCSNVLGWCCQLNLNSRVCPFSTML